jgi:hypothetical protein
LLFLIGQHSQQAIKVSHQQYGAKQEENEAGRLIKHRIQVLTGDEPEILEPLSTTEARATHHPYSNAIGVRRRE